MNMEEYLKVKDFTYLEYCDYLQAKYGIGLADYMTKSFNPNPKCKRTKEGLVAHHKKEDTDIWLCKKEFAKLHPIEWQSKENIVYCDYLEHLLLHVLICKYPSTEASACTPVGIGGILAFIVPELNDVYSGWVSDLQWQRNCHDRIIADKDVYFAILKQLMITGRIFDVEQLCRSYNESIFNGRFWDGSKNAQLYEEIKYLNNEDSNKHNNKKRKSHKKNRVLKLIKTLLK